MRRAAIVAPLRTAVGGYGKALRTVPVEDLAATVVKAVVQRSGIDPERIEDVSFAQSYANSEVPCIGRWIALHAGLPEHVADIQIDRRCGGGLQAIVRAAMTVQTGAADVVLAGGAESMSRIEHYTTDVRWGRRSGGTMLHDRLDRGRERAQPEWRHGYISGMVETAENVAGKYGITREQADAYAASSHAKAAAAWSSGRFAEEVVPVEVPGQRGTAPSIFDHDECIRPDTTPDTLARLKPVIADGTVTAGNASGSGISLGHPIGATGTRMMVTLLHELGRRGGGLGLETMCIGGGQGMAAVFEVPTSAVTGVTLPVLSAMFMVLISSSEQRWPKRRRHREQVRASSPTAYADRAGVGISGGKHVPFYAEARNRLAGGRTRAATSASPPPLQQSLG
jgi:acetyl-CoA acetyltransferase